MGTEMNITAFHCILGTWC